MNARPRSGPRRSPDRTRAPWGGSRLLRLVFHGARSLDHGLARPLLGLEVLALLEHDLDLARVLDLRGPQDVGDEVERKHLVPRRIERHDPLRGEVTRTPHDDPVDPVVLVSV